MAKKKIENQKTFSDFTNKSWFMDKDNVKVGESISKILAGESQTLEVKDILFGDKFQTWKIVIDKTDKIYLLKTSRELK
jgi:hypothetical protein